VLHTHITFRDAPRITTFDEALPLADHCLDFPPGTLLAVLLGVDGDVIDALVFEEGDRSPIEVVEFVSRHAREGESLIVAMNRRSCDPRADGLSDVETWETMSAVADANGLVLRDWFLLIGDLLWVPSELSESGAGW
jgi:hypothetical protein